MLRRTCAIAVILVLALLGTASVAQAETTVFRGLGCGTHHFERTFTIPYRTQLVLYVHHYPGRWGQMTVTNSAGREVWSFRQSYAWIEGFYGVWSESLPAGVYSVNYWSDNLAQAQSLCHGTLLAN